jgi:exonuclease SbcD
MDQQDQQQEQSVITIVLTADNHLGYTIPGQPGRKREELRQRLRRAFQQVTDFAIAQGVDLFLQAGDLFDSIHPDEQDRSFVAERLAELKQAGIHSFAVGGLHDTPGETHTHAGEAASSVLAPQLSYARLGALQYFPPQAGETLHPFLLNIRGTLVGICGLSAVQPGQPGLSGQSEQSGEALARVRVDNEIERAALPILLLSTPLEEEPSTPTVASPLSSLLAQTPFRLVLAGYHHAYRHFTSGQADVVIAGATHRFNFQDPTGEPGFVFLGIAASGLRWCRQIPVESIHLRRLEIPLAQWWTATQEKSDSSETSRVTARVAPTLDRDSSDTDSSRVGATLAVTLENAPLDGDSSDTDSSRVGATLAVALENAPVTKNAPVTENAPTARLLEELRPLCTEDALVQLRLTGAISRQRYHQLELASIRRYGEAHAFAFSIDDSSLTFLPGDDGETGAAPLKSFEERLSPREELIALADEWIAAAQDEQEQKALLATKEELLAALWKGV